MSLIMSKPALSHVKLRQNRLKAVKSAGLRPDLSVAEFPGIYSAALSKDIFFNINQTNPTMIFQRSYLIQQALL